MIHFRVQIQVRLVPVEVFGAECDKCQEPFGYGLSDAVAWWSDCNRAFGHIYRFDDLGGDREPGDSLTVWVDRAEYEAFSARRFGADEETNA